MNSTIQALMLELELNQSEVSRRIAKETRCIISPTTIGRAIKGEASDVTTALIIYVLEGLKEDSDERDLIVKGYQGSHSYDRDSETSFTTHFIEASNEEHAIQKLMALGFAITQTRNETDYDCTGQWYCSPPTVDYLKGRHCYAVTNCFTLDV